MSLACSTRPERRRLCRQFYRELMLSGFTSWQELLLDEVRSSWAVKLSAVHAADTSS